MGRKQKKNKRVTLTLSEFNEEGGGDPELLSLPSAPKAPEEWDAVGGKPEYNSRGYRERLPGGPPGRGGDRGGRDFSGYGAGGSDDVDHDWTRRGPIDGGHDNEGRPERDWSDMRRSRNALDAGNEMPERDWNEMRRGPVDSSFGGMSGGRDGAGGEERDWSQRIGPIDSNEASQVRAEANWSEARGGRVVESKFHPYDAAPTEPDREPNWSQRRGPVEAATSKPPQGANDDDWSAPRKGPVESEFGQQSMTNTVDDRDWSERRGPVEANLPSNTTFGSEERERDWSERRGPVEAVVPSNEQKDRHQSESFEHVSFGDINGDDDEDQDWSAVRASPLPPTGNETEGAKSRDFSTAVPNDSRSEWTRRGPVQSKAEEVAEQQAARQQQQQNEGEGGNVGGRGRGRIRRGGGSFGRSFAESEGGSRFNSEQNSDHQSSGSGSWRRDGGSGVASRGRRSRNSYGRPVSTGSENFNEGSGEFGGERERDWGAARRSMPAGREAKPIDTLRSKTPSGNEDEENSNDASNAHAKGKGKGGRRDGGSNEETKTAEDEKRGDENAEDGVGETTDGTDAVDDDEWTTVRGSSRRESRMLRRGVEREHNGFHSSSGRWRGSGRGPPQMGRPLERNLADGRKKPDRQNNQNRREVEYVRGSGFDRFNSLGIDFEAETDSGDIDVDVDGDGEENAQVTKDQSADQYSSVKPISPANA